MFSVLQRRETGLSSPTKLYDAAKANKYFIQRLRLERRLEVHRGCVNTICWNESGSSILSGSDDQHLVISDPFTGQIRASIRSGHHSNIFCAKFLPNSQDQEIVSCSGAGSIYYTQVDREDMYGKCLFDCHVGTTYELVVVPNEARTFLTCGEDGTVRWFDLRIKTSCNKERCKDDVLINCRNAVTSISVDPVLPYQLATACADGSVRVFDRRMLGTRLSGTYSSRLMTGLVSRFVAPLENKAHRITSLNYGPSSHDILVSYSAENVYLFNTQLEESKHFFKTEAEAEAKGPANGAEASATAGLDPTNQPPTKRLRLRGDWSDTGPNARPERERTEDAEGPPQVNLMQRMSDMLTRWLDGSIRRRGEEQEGGAAPLAEGGNPEPGQEGADDPGLAAAESSNLSASLEAERASQNLEQEGGGEGEGGALREESAPRESEQRGELLSAGSDGRGMLDEGGVSEDEEERSEEPCVAGIREDVMDPRSELDRAAARSEEVETRREGSSSQQVDRSEETLPALRGRKSEMARACSSVACVSDTPVAELSDGVSYSESTSHVSRSDRVDEQAVTSGSAPLNESHMQSGGKEAVPNSSESAGLTEQVGGVGSDNSEPATCSHQHTVPQTQPQTHNSAHELLTDPGSHVVDSSTMPALDMPLGSSAGGGGGGGSGSSHNGSTGMAATSSPGVCGPGATATSTRLEPVISLHYSQEGTTASTIHVAYTTFDIMDPPHSQPTSLSQPPSLSAAQSQPAGAQCGAVLDAPTAETLPPCSSASADTGLPEAALRGAEGGGVREASPQSQPGELQQSASLTHSHPQEQTTVESCSDATSHNPSAAAVNNTQGQTPSASAGLPSQRGATAGTSGVSSGGTRHRRMGHSGPPTGDFQLVLNPEDDEDSDDEDEDRESLPSRSVPFWSYGASSTDERHYAAMCMQSMYRRRMEEREKQAMASVFQPRAQLMYTGHRNSRTMIKESNFWGEKVVMSGSDCGRIFLWDRDTTELIMLLEADRHVVNCLQPHPYDPVLASSGIDYDVKIWAPLESEPCFDVEAAEEVMRRNQIMLEETRDTITVPAAFMLRVLASLNQIRAGRAGAGAGGGGGAGRGGGGGEREQEESPGDSD